MLEAAIEAGANDVPSSRRAGTRSTCAPEDLARGRARRSKRNSASRARQRSIWRPQNTVAVDDESGEKLIRLVGTLEDNDDVQNVYANFEISDALMAKMEG